MNYLDFCKKLISYLQAKLLFFSFSGTSKDSCSANIAVKNGVLYTFDLSSKSNVQFIIYNYDGKVLNFDILDECNIEFQASNKDGLPTTISISEANSFTIDYDLGSKEELGLSIQDGELTEITMSLLYRTTIGHYSTYTLNEMEGNTLNELYFI